MESIPAEAARVDPFPILRLEGAGNNCLLRVGAKQHLQRITHGTFEQSRVRSSWNKAVRSGYAIVRVPLHRTERASGEYQDFLTGFALPNGQVCGRPVGVTTAPDGAVLVTDDGANSNWWISYVGEFR